MMTKILAAYALLITTACVTIPAVKLNGSGVALGQTAYVDGPKIRPITIIEDSRCPMNARCVWEGRVRILVAWVKADGEQQVELTLGEPVSIADGALTLTDVKPSNMAGESKGLAPSDYRFSFQFAGGL